MWCEPFWCSRGPLPTSFGAEVGLGRGGIGAKDCGSTHWRCGTERGRKRKLLRVLEKHLSPSICIVHRISRPQHLTLRDIYQLHHLAIVQSFFRWLQVVNVPRVRYGPCKIIDARTLGQSLVQLSAINCSSNVPAQLIDGPFNNSFNIHSHIFSIRQDDPRSGPQTARGDGSPSTFEFNRKPHEVAPAKRPPRSPNAKVRMAKIACVPTECLEA